MTHPKRLSLKKRPPPPPPPEPLYLIGLHPVREALQHRYRFKKLYLQKSLREDVQEPLIAQCKDLGIPFYFETREALTTLSRGALHQGIVAELKKGPQLQNDLETFLKQRSTAKPSIIIVADHISDPRNLGALSRTALFFGCEMIVLEQSHTAPLSEVVHKTSAGASLLLPYYISPQMTKALHTLKAAGYTLICSTLREEPHIIPLSELSLRIQNLEKLVLIIGNEAKGVRPHLQRLADIHIHITSPTSTSFNSLNLSVATGIILYSLHHKNPALKET